jgi:hypothetical protein
MGNIPITPNPILINFRLPKHLKYSMDRLVKFKGVSRSSVLINLIEGWINQQNSQILEHGNIHQIMTQLENTIERSVLRQNPQTHLIPSKPSKTHSWEDSY